MMRAFLLIFVLLLSAVGVNAQSIQVQGRVTSAEDGEGVPGASVVIKGTTDGVSTDYDGNFTLNASSNDILVISFVGYTTQEIKIGNQTRIDVVFESDLKALDEVVIIGYGVQRKSDATGAIEQISASDFNQGAITSPTDLISGKTPGVTITSGGGAPGSGATIRIRGGSSLSASNDPLFVIDGIPVDNKGIAGARNPLNSINPSDIETFTVLKDASATAIYGSRASNGVVIITTKKGKEGQDLKVQFDAKTSVGTLVNKVDVLSADEYRTLFTEKFGDNVTAMALLGDGNTDWQDEIYQTSIGQEYNASVTGAYKFLPYRVSVGYSDQEGILKTSELQRSTLGVNLNPSFFDEHLKMNLNLKGSFIENRFADEGAIGSAVTFDPTQTVMGGPEKYGNYFTWGKGAGDAFERNTLAPANPLALLNQKNNSSEVSRFIGNIQFDYKLHFLPELRFNLNLGYDLQKGEGEVISDVNAAFADDATLGRGRVENYEEEKENRLLDFYANYRKEFDGIESVIDVMGGYSYQYFNKEYFSQGRPIEQKDGAVIPNSLPSYGENVLVSFFGRFNYTFKDRYLLTATFRQDGSSRFADGNQWGLFPSAALAWKINEESFMQNQELVSNLKIRLGYGITGQQDIGDDFYPYLGTYTNSQDGAKYIIGTNGEKEIVDLIRPNAYDENIKWEETTTYNIGLDFGFLEDRITGAVDVYQRETDDLISTIPTAAGSNFKNLITTNVGNLENRGVELALNGTLVRTEDFNWDLGFNATFNENEITKLTQNEDPNFKGILVGGISGGTGNTIQINAVGHSINSFYVFEQVYNEEGNPIEGLFVDRNEDGLINENDKYISEKPSADVTLGISSSMNYKNWDFSFAGRASLGNYVYNNLESSNAKYNSMYGGNPFLGNVTKDIYETNFEGDKSDQIFSDYYIQDGSFFRMDHITLGYSFNELYKGKGNARVYATVQNAFVISDYKGLDPEVFSGIDNNFYPRPRTFVLGVNVNF